jgi:hypothetical protein
MSQVSEAISRIKDEWGEPREAVHHGLKCPFLLQSSFSSEPVEALDRFPVTMPNGLRDFWSLADSATLFKDVGFGQWGVEIFNPHISLQATSEERRARASEFSKTDLIIGRFIGDLERLLIECNQKEQSFGQIVVVLPIDKRCDWRVIANSLGDFLMRLADAQGAKYWEGR